MNTDEATLDALIDASATWLGLTIDPDWRPAVRQNLVTLARAIDAIEQFSLSDDAEPMAVYQPAGVAT